MIRFIISCCKFRYKFTSLGCENSLKLYSHHFHWHDQPHSKAKYRVLVDSSFPLSFVLVCLLKSLVNNMHVWALDFLILHEHNKWNKKIRDQSKKIFCILCGICIFLLRNNSHSWLFAFVIACTCEYFLLKYCLMTHHLLNFNFFFLEKIPRLAHKEPMLWERAASCWGMICLQILVLR